MVNLESAPLDELHKEFARLADVVGAAEGERKAIQQEVNRRRDQAALKARVRELDPAERAALKEVL